MEKGTILLIVIFWAACSAGSYLYLKTRLTDWLSLILATVGGPLALALSLIVGLIAVFLKDDYNRWHDGF